MLRYTITIPTCYNDNGPVDVTIIDSFVTIAAALAGGATLHPVSQGTWINADGVTCGEPVRVLEVVGDEKIRGKLRLLCIMIRDRLRQDCILFTSTPINTEFI